MPDLESICYNKNYLKNVIFRIDYSHLSQIKSIVPPEFYEKIIEKFPKYEMKEIIAQKIEVKDIKSVTSTQDRFNNFEFNNEEKNKKIVLSSNYLSVEYKAYDKFKEFQNNIELAYNSLKELDYELNISRIGLRYINEIILESGHPYKWEGLLNNALFCGDAGLPNQSNISRKMTQVIYNFEDDVMNFQYGIANSEFPAKISKKEYVLDYDCWSTLIEPNDVLVKLSSFHEIIQELFEFSIEEELRNIMGVKNEH